MNKKVEKNKRVIFLSMRMHGRSAESIIETRNKMIDVIKAMYPNEELGFIDNARCDVAVAPDMLQEGRLLYLGEAIKKMAYCNTIAVIDNDHHYGEKHGCDIEEHVARSYGFEFIRLNETGSGTFYPDLNEKFNEKMNNFFEGCNKALKKVNDAVQKVEPMGTEGGNQ